MSDGTKSYYAFATVLTVLSLMLSGCVFEYSECPEGKAAITIVNDWKHAPEAAPEGMAYLFYEMGSGGLWRFDFPGRNAGEVYLYEGCYRFVMYNDDTSDVVFETLPDGMPEAVMGKAAIDIEGLEGELRRAPDMMWGGYMPSVMVGYDDLKYEYEASDGEVTEESSRKMILQTAPRQLTPLYTVKVLKTANWSGVESCTGVITGMSEGLELFGDNPCKESVGVNFNLQMNADSVLTGTFANFGLPVPEANVGNKNEVRLYFRLSDGRTICNIYDRTEEVRNAADRLNVELVIDSIDLPVAPPAIKGGAFDPAVSPWKEIVLNYET